MSKILSLVGGKDCKEVTQKTTQSFPHYSLGIYHAYENTFMEYLYMCLCFKCPTFF